MKSLKLLPTIANVSAGNTVTVGLPVGNVYESIVLYYTNATPAQLKNIKLEVNGRMISEFADGERLVSIDKHYNRAQTANALTFHFNRPELHQLNDKRFFGLDTSRSQGISTANISIDIDSDATDITLQAYAVVVQSVPNVPNYLTKVRRFIVPVSGAGQFDIDNIPRPIGASISAIHLYKDDITKAELLVDNVNWHDVPASVAVDMQKANGRAPESGDSSVIDLILDGDIKHALPLTQKISDFRLRCTAGSAGQVEVMVEYVDLYGAGRF
jgi:hypothetical protein